MMSFQNTPNSSRLHKESWFLWMVKISKKHQLLKFQIFIGMGMCDDYVKLKFIKAPSQFANFENANMVSFSAILVKFGAFCAAV